LLQPLAPETTLFGKPGRARLHPESRDFRPVKRDCLHLSIGPPKGWDATSAIFYVAEDFNLAGMDTVAMLQELMDSAELYATRLQRMSRGENMAEFFAEKTSDLDIDTLDSPKHPTGNGTAV
jgi:predicted ATPase